MKKLLLLLASCAITIPLWASDLPPVQELMSGEEMEITGLDKLTPEELQALREWMEVFISRDAEFVMKEYQQATKEAREDAEEKGSMAPLVTEARGNRFDKSERRIVGEFYGWDGRTRFTLDNGEVWEQRKPDSMRRTRVLKNPEVRISKNFFGFYVMEVPEADVSVPVSRIR